jgi:hypothetical protein
MWEWFVYVPGAGPGDPLQLGRVAAADEGRALGAARQQWPGESPRLYVVRGDTIPPADMPEDGA